MTNLQEHRLYRYLSEPVRFVGLTIDELILGVVGITAVLAMESMTGKFIALVGTGISVWLVKKYKKVIAGFSLASWIHWHFGVSRTLSSSWPPSNKRYWLP